MPPRAFVGRGVLAAKRLACAEVSSSIASMLAGGCLGDVTCATVGLDVSLRNTGFAVVRHDGVLLDRGVVSTPPAASVVECGVAVSLQLSALSRAHSKVHSVYLEEFMKQFATGRFHTRGLFSLAQLNGICEFEAARLFGVQPAVVMPNRVRSAFGVVSSGTDDVKSAVLDVVSNMYPEIVWETKRGASNKSVRRTAYDQADAILVALFGVLARMQDHFVACPQLLCTFLRHAARIHHVDSEEDMLRDLGALCEALVASGGQWDAAASPPRWAAVDEPSVRCLQRLYTKFGNVVQDSLTQWFLSQQFGTAAPG